MEGTWQCGRCLLRNPSSKQSCQACRTKKRMLVGLRELASGGNIIFRDSPITWKCSQCNSVNHDPRSNCQLCRMSRTTPKPLGRPLQRIANKSRLPQPLFHIGTHPHPRQPSSLALTREVRSWICASCMLENDIKSKRCLRCGYSHPDVWTGKRESSPSVLLISNQQPNAKPPLISNPNPRYHFHQKHPTPRGHLVDSTVIPTALVNEHKEQNAKNWTKGYKEFPFHRARRKKPKMFSDSQPDLKSETHSAKITCSYCERENAVSNTTCAFCDARLDRAGSHWLKNPNSVTLHSATRLERQFSRETDPESGWLSLQSVKDEEAAQKIKARQKWENICSECFIRRENFVDPDFPPNWRSIATCDDMTLKWRRIQSTRTSFFGRWKMSRNGYNPDDIQQGSLGDCWLLSSLAVLAQYPDHIDRIVLTKQMNGQGCYQVRLFENGKRRVVILDDYFPVTRSGSLAFARGKHNQLWVPLIEKAMAKLVGGYGHLIAGTTSEAFGALTGAPSGTIKINNPDFNSEETFQRLKCLKTAGYLLALSCGSGGIIDESIYRKKGLMSEHAYSLLDVREISDYQTKKTYRLFKIRNPWGEIEWSGDYSRYSSAWRSCKKIREICKPYNLSRGMFWIDYTNLMKYFSRITVCYFGKDWNSLPLAAVIPVSKLVPQTFYLVRASEPSAVFFQLFQPTQRGSQNIELKYTDLGLFVVECNPSNLIDTTRYKPVALILSTRQQHLYVEAFLQRKKTYLIIPYRTVPDLNACPCSISIYSPVPLASRKVEANLSNLLAPIAHICLTGGLQVKKSKKLLQNGVHVTKYESSRGMGYKNSIWVLAENTTTRAVEIGVTIANAKNVIVPRNSLVTKDVILPGHIQIVAVLVNEKPDEPWAYSLRFVSSTARNGEVHFPALEYGDLYTPLPIHNVVLPQGGDNYGLWRRLFGL